MEFLAKPSLVRIGILLDDFQHLRLDSGAQMTIMSVEFAKKCKYASFSELELNWFQFRFGFGIGIV
jgi:hypothetical protein